MIKSLLILLYLLPLSSIAAASVLCENVFRDQNLTVSEGDELAKRFPNLAFAIRDRDAFFTEMQARFEEQKSLTPENPHSFDYSEIGLPTLRFMRTELAIQRLGASGFHMALKSGKKAASKNFKPSYRDIEVYIQHVNELITEIDQRLQFKKISYYDTLRISNYYARVAGYGHLIDHSFLQKTQLKFDRYLEGYKPLTPQEEYDLFKENRFFVFQDGQRSGLMGYRDAQDSFIKSILDKNELKVVIIPTHESIDQKVLMWLFSRPQIYISGVSAKSIQADGFLRPAGDFWYHDLRHESAKFYERHLYETSNEIPGSKRHELSLQLDKWEHELSAEIAKVEDPELRSALSLMSFNFHHDSGYPTAPSLFLKKFRLGKITAFWFSLVVGGEKTFAKPIRNLMKARLILKKFWADRQNQEQKFIQSLKGAN